MEYPVKQVIVVRRDLKMRQGKACSQAAHASGEFMRRYLLQYLDGEDFTPSDIEVQWMRGGMAKITTKAETEAHFYEVVDAARAAGLQVHLITDAGRTEFHGIPTVTAAAIGPAHFKDVDPITGGLNLL